MRRGEDWIAIEVILGFLAYCGLILWIADAIDRASTWYKNRRRSDR